MNPDESILWMQVALGFFTMVTTIITAIMKEMSDRRRASELAATVLEKEHQAELERQHLAQEIKVRTATLETKLDANTALTTSAVTQAGQAYSAANRFNEKLEAIVLSKFDALRSTQTGLQETQLAAQTKQLDQQADRIERIDTTTTESKQLLEDIHDATPTSTPTT